MSGQNLENYVYIWKRPSSLVSFKWSTSHHTSYDNLTEKHHISTEQTNNMWRCFTTCSFYCLILRSKQYTLGNKYSAIWIGKDKRLSGILPRLVFLYRGYSIYSVAKIKQEQVRTENHLGRLQQNKKNILYWAKIKERKEWIQQSQSNKFSIINSYIWKILFNIQNRLKSITFVFLFAIYLRTISIMRSGKNIFAKHHL